MANKGSSVLAEPLLPTEATWDAWREPLIAKARQLEEIARCSEPAKESLHPLSRPGVQIVLPTFQKRYHVFDFQLSGFPTLRTFCGHEHEGAPGVFLAVPHSTSRPARLTPLILSRPWTSQYHTSIAEDMGSFGHAHIVLDRALASFAEGTPLDAGWSWKDALREELRSESSTDADKTEWHVWSYWVHRWGTPEMVSAFNLVNNLFDFDEQPDECRAYLLESWDNLGKRVQPDVIDCGALTEGQSHDIR